MKSKKKQTASEMMTLEGDSIPQPVRKKRGGLRLKAKHHRRLKKALAVGSAFAILVGGTFGINAIFFNKAAPNIVEKGFETVRYDVPTDGSTPDLHSALENIGYMNARFSAQPVWYSEMGGTVDTVLKQSVNTWKQYADGVLIQTDITTSSLVDSAKQFCWVGDRVIWREAAGGSSIYDGINTQWRDGDPVGNMSVEEFKATRGLPGTSFSVYVINEQTLLDATAVTDNGDGTYTQTYYLDPATDKAPAYYVNQMMFTGGLTSLPVFEYITVTYTFDATWQVLSSDIEEAYTATKGVNARCTATYHTAYEYGSDKAYSIAYDDYFKNYADKPATGAPSEDTLTAVDCLAEAFGAVLTKPVTFAVDLTLNGEPYSGLVYVDVSDMSDISLRASIGNIFLQYAGGDVYLRYGNGVKAKLSVEELTALLSSLTGGEAAGDGLSFDTDALLSQLGGGEVKVSEDRKSATLESELLLFGRKIPVRFAFNVSETGVSLGSVSADIAVSEDLQIGARLAFSQETVPDLTEQEKTEYVALIPYVERILDILSGEAVSLDVSYAAEDFSVAGKIDVMFKDEFLVQGTLRLGYRSAAKEIAFSFKDGVVYLAAEGIKLKANVEDAIAFIENFLTLPELPSSLPAIDLGGLLNTVLSSEFADNFVVSESDGALSVAVKGTQLLSLFGVDFALGDVALGVEEDRITASALGAQMSMSKTEAFSVATEGYIDAVGLAQDIYGLLSQDYLAAQIAYSSGDLTVGGTVTLDLEKLVAKGTVTLGYQGVSKTVGLLYADGAVYVDIEGMKLTAEVDELVAFLSQVLGADLSVGTPEGDLLEQVLSLNFAELVSLSENDGTVEVLLKGTELLQAFGVDFALGDVKLGVEEGRLTASALGAQIEVVAGEAFSYSTDGYAELSPVIELLGTAIRDGRIAMNGSLTLGYKDMTLGVAIRNGVLAWKDAFALRLDLVITVNGTEQTILVDADASRIRLVYGTVGVELKYDELYQLSDTFESVYERIASILSASVVGKGLPETAEELSAAIGAGAAVTDLFASIDLPSLIGGIKFGKATETEGSIGTITYQNFVFDLLLSDGALSLALGETSVGDVRLLGTLGVSAAERAPQQIEQSGLMTVADLCELLDFAGAAVGTIASPNVTISFTGATLDASAINVFDISGEFVYHSGLAGSGLPIVIDVDGKTITVNPDAYLYFRLVLDDRRADGTDLYLDFWMLDAGDDGELDFYVSISKYAEGDPSYQPLRFAVPASEIMTLLSSGISLVEGKLAQFLTGLDLPQETVDALFSTLDSFFVSKWLTDTDKAQLGALGNILMGTLGIDKALEDVLAGLGDTVGGALDDVTAVDPGKYLSALGIKRGENGEISFYVTLNSDLIYGGSDLAPLTIALTKQAGETGSLLKGILLENIWGNGNSETTSVGFGFGFAPVTLTETEDKTSASLSFEKDGSALTRTLNYADYGSYTFAGADELVKSIAASATHETQDGYALNESFFISGTANISIGSWNAVTIKVDGLSVRVDAAGNIQLNLKISYSKEGLVGNLAFASSGTSELTMKDGMMYLRRTAGGKTEHRVMPASNFFASIMDQMVFLLNFSSFVQGLIPSDSEDTTGGAVTDDYGIILSDVLSSYRYTKGETGNTWALTLNGPALTGVLEDIVITLNSTQYAGQENILRALDVNTSLSVLGITANLMFRNPCDVWEDGYSDTTQDIAAVFASVEGLASFDWGKQAEDFYLIPQQSTVYFAVDGTQVASQDVWYSGNLLLSALRYPDLSSYEQREGYTLDWKSFTFTPGGTIEAAYLPNLYDVTIVAPVQVDEDWKDNGDGTYSFAMQMYYGETLTLTWGDNQYVFTVGTQGNVFDLSAAIGEDSVLWNEIEADILTSGSTVRVPLTPDTIVYTSSGVAFTLGGETGTTVSAEFDAQYTLATPSADGYTFLGWYVWDGNAPVKVTELSYAGGGMQTTVSALWLSNLTNGAIDTSKKGSWFSYDQTISVRASGGQLVGEYAQSFEVTASVDMTLKWNLTSYDLDFSSFTISQTADGWQTTAATAHTPVSDPTVRATLTVNVLLDGQSVGSTNISLSKKC